MEKNQIRFITVSRYTSIIEMVSEVEIQRWQRVSPVIDLVTKRVTVFLSLRLYLNLRSGLTVSIKFGEVKFRPA